jgi:hypothetical protein
MAPQMYRSHLRILVAWQVRTIDGFQGREKDVIVVTAVRSNSRDEVGFLCDVRRWVLLAESELLASC